MPRAVAKPTPTDDAVKRARRLLDKTAYFDELGHHKLACDSRNVARDVLELAEQLGTERSARVALQNRCERLQDLIGKHAYDALADTA